MDKKINEYIDSLLASTPEKPLWNAEILKGNKTTSWNYIDGCMLTSLLELYKLTKNEKYFNFVKTYVDYFVSDDGIIKTYQLEKYELDSVCESKILFDLYELTKLEKYKLAIDFTNKQLLTQPRTKEGNFSHKLIYPNQIWLDGIYMALPFLTRLGKEDDVKNQLLNVRKCMFDENKKLYYHAYDSERIQFWANKKSGLSKSFWLRAIGWFLVGLVDIFDYSKSKELKNTCSCLLKEAIEGILLYKDKNTNMFYQVVDKADKKGNYLETSGSLMVAYACLKGSRLNILDKKYRQIGEDIFKGVIYNKLKIIDGKLNLSDICIMAGVGPNDKPHRDGTFEYYISEPIVENDAKGVGPLVMAYIETLK